VARNDGRRLKRQKRHYTRELKGAELVIVRLYMLAQVQDYLLSRSRPSNVDAQHVRHTHQEWQALSALVGPEVAKVMNRA
jgi:hypothetical protein